jgi:uncharacterized protein YqeY
MTFKELQAAMVAAMKEKNRVKKEVIADMVACAKNMAIEQGCKDSITDEIVAAAILKSKKMCQDQIDTCPANRPDKLEAYNLCMTYINELAPKMMTEEEVLKVVKDWFEQVSVLYKDNNFNKGAFMKIIMPELKGKADGKVISAAVDKVLKNG